jgi:hypothetical protein
MKNKTILSVLMILVFSILAFSVNAQVIAHYGMDETLVSEPIHNNLTGVNTLYLNDYIDGEYFQNLNKHIVPLDLKTDGNHNIAIYDGIINNSRGGFNSTNYAYQYSPFGNDTLDNTYSQLTGYQDYSISFWIKRINFDIPNPTEYISILGNLNSGTQLDSFYIANNKVIFNSQIVGICDNEVTVPILFDNSSYYFITLVHIGRNLVDTQLLLYLNGVLIDSETPLCAVATAKNLFLIGILYDGLSYSMHSFALDEYNIFDTALTESQITQLYNNGTGAVYPYAFINNPVVIPPVTNNTSGLPEFEDRIKDFASALGFISETSKLLFWIIIIIIIMFVIIKSDLESKVKGTLSMLLIILLIIAGWKLGFVSTPIFIFIVFIVAIVGALVLRNLYSGTGA